MKNPEKFIVATSLATITLLGTTACSGTNKATTPIELTPDMSGFLQPNSTTLCFNGGERPCGILIRSEPHLDAPYVNTDSVAGRVTWPLESYGDQSGNKVEVECYTPDGQAIASYKDSLASTEWYKVIVPAKFATDKATTQGWASVEWFGTTKSNAQVPKC